MTDEDLSLLTISPEPTAQVLNTSAGQRVGRGFTQADLLGEGGMGAVFRGEQSCFPREVALKSLLPSRDTPQARLHFTAEAVITALLDHPNIPPVYDLLTDSQQPRLAMKIIEGADWRQLLRDPTATTASGDPLRLEDHLDILLKVCDAVAFAHDQGIIHRDLKPANVMVGAFGEVTVMDWGCAGAYRAPSLHPLIPQLAERDGIAGTPAYLAPEMVQGIGQALGPHSDIFLLGACLYEILTGTAPHHAPHQRSSAVTEILSRAIGPSIDPPHQRAPEREIPPGLSQIALRAMAFEPAQRYATVQAFTEAIRAWRQEAQLDRVLAIAQRTIIRAEGGDGQALSQGLWEAIAGCEYVRTEIPHHPTATQLLVQALMLTARHALKHESWDMAQRQLDRANTLALPFSTLSKEIADASEEIRHAIIRGRKRQRFVVVMGWSSYGLLGLILVVSVFVYLQLSGNEQRATFALAEAQRLHAETTKLGQQATQATELAAADDPEAIRLAAALRQLQDERQRLTPAIEALQAQEAALRQEQSELAERLLREWAAHSQRQLRGPNDHP
ncbi:MAG: hypothetical protein EA401_10705 [Planctomycetota bacterium]|nr:MAG: hypothetical protein EA401_10705 [Planctomycetota bacterium]